MSTALADDPSEVSPGLPASLQEAPGDLHDWDSIVAAAQLGGIAKQLAVNCLLQEVRGETVRLLLDSAQENLNTERPKQRLAEALGEHFSFPVRLEIRLGRPDRETAAQRDQRLAMERQRRAELAIEQDPHVRAMRESLGARVLPNSIRPGKA